MRYELTDKDMDLIVKLTRDWIGSTTLDGKKELMNNRFNKILRDLGYKVEGKEVIEGLKSGKYKQEFINVFTTNTTRFFREPEQFEFILNKYQKSGKINVWSAAASSGEEAHTMAIVLNQKKQKDGNEFDILGSDISTKVIKAAESHTYQKSKVYIGTPSWVENYEENWKEVYANNVKTSAALNMKMRFEKADLLDEKTISHIGQFDLVFCRNMLIYFNKDLQTKIIKNIFKKVKVGGYLFLGHSETPWGIEEKIEKIAGYHNIFKKIKD